MYGYIGPVWTEESELEWMKSNPSPTKEFIHPRID
jgi:hypothetical protein